MRLIQVGPLGQRDHTIKLPVAAFRAVVSFTLFFMLAFAFALNHQAFVGDFHLDVTLLDSGQIGDNLELAVTLGDFDRGSPQRSLLAPAARALKYMIHFFGEPAHQRKRAHAEKLRRIHR